MSPIFRSFRLDLSIVSCNPLKYNEFLSISCEFTPSGRRLAELTLEGTIEGDFRLVADGMGDLGNILSPARSFSLASLQCASA